MSFQIRAVCTVVLTTALAGLGCSANSEPTENVAQSNDALSVYQWSADQKAAKRQVTAYVVADAPVLPAPAEDWPDARRALESRL